MNLYQIQFSHHSPKDAEFGIKCLLLAQDDNEVYEWMASNPTAFGERIHTGWKNKEDDNKIFFIYNDQYENVGEESFKQKIIRLTGEIDDPSFDFSDAYYSITLYGWDLLVENVSTDYSELETLGFIQRII